MTEPESDIILSDQAAYTFGCQPRFAPPLRWMLGCGGGPRLSGAWQEGVSNFRMCTDKVRFTTELEAFAEAMLQQSHRRHWVWSWYECLWCDFWHIGRRSDAEGHDDDCRAACGRAWRKDRETRILEGTW